MSESEILFKNIGNQFPDAAAGQLFGKPCFKRNGKAFVCFFRDEMVFKLKGDAHSDALAMEGAVLFDPSGKHRPMKEWVQVPYKHSLEWQKYAEYAYQTAEPV